MGNYDDMLKRLAAYRHSLGLLQKQIGGMVGLSQEQYSYLESGTIRISNDNLRALSATGLDTDYLITGKTYDYSAQELDVLLQEFEDGERDFVMKLIAEVIVEKAAKGSLKLKGVPEQHEAAPKSKAEAEAEPGQSGNALKSKADAEQSGNALKSKADAEQSGNALKSKADAEQSGNTLKSKADAEQSGNTLKPKADAEQSGNTLKSGNGEEWYASALKLLEAALRSWDDFSMIEFVREERGFSQIDMAQMLGVGIKKYRDIERETRYPDAEMLISLYDMSGYQPALFMNLHDRRLLALKMVWQTLEEDERSGVLDLIRSIRDII